MDRKLRKEYFTFSEVCNALQDRLEYESKYGMYAPLMARLDIYIDDEIPPADRKNMNSHGHSPMAIHDKDGSGQLRLYIDRDNLYYDVNNLRAKYEEKYPSQYMAPLNSEVNNILIHELTHALCQHTYQGLQFFKPQLESGKGISKREQLAWTIACEIEANRGYGIRQSQSPVYAGGITDDSPYPKAKSAKYLVDIYNLILEEYGDQLDDDSDEVENMVNKMLKSGGNEKDGQGDGNQGGNEESSKDSNGNGEKSQEGAGEKDSSTDSDGEGEAGSKGGETEAERQSRERREMMAKAMVGLTSRPVPRKYDPKDYENRTYEEIKDGQEGQAYGMGGGGVDVSGKSPAAILNEWEHIYNKKVLEKALAKLKGDMVGHIAKERVSTYSRQARRDSSDGLLKKGTKRGARNQPKILVALDKSGSMSSTTTAQATEALAKVFEVTGRPTQGCWICMHDGDVSHVKPFKQWKSVIAYFYPYGGNDFSKLVKLANKLDVDIVLNVGDAGDTINRSLKDIAEFRKRGRRWIDVNIAKESRRYNAEWVEQQFVADYVKTGVLREWQDLTGQLEYSVDELLANVKKRYPDAYKKWAKK